MFCNREFRHFAILLSLIATVTIILGFTINALAVILSTISVSAFIISFFVFTQARYKSIAKISNQIDTVLHNENHLYIEEAQEGELSILHKNDIKRKKHLADSLADIAHQLRTPLTSANLILSLLTNSTDESEKKSFIREAEELLVHMDWLITSLLKLSRLDAGIVVFQSEQVDINNLIYTSVHPFLIPMELHNIDLQIDVPKGIVIQGDSGWLSEAIQNVIKNCMESAGENGKIEIVCTDTLLFTEITIHDSGAGFEKEDLHYIFERFHRGKNSTATGYGIGLALCKMIIVNQGGTITAKNHSNGGAVFIIRFPK